jgi:hypothetical protein
LGRFSDSVNYQAKALKFNGTPQFRFILSKYQIRNGEVSEGISNLSKSIDDDPIYAVAAFKEIDLINAPEVLNLISSKNQDIDSEIGKLLVKWKAVESAEASEVIQELALLSQKSYETKVAQLKLFEKKANEVSATQFEIDSFISEMNITSFSTIDELTKAKDRPLEKMRDAFDTIKKQIYADRIQIGSMYAGGIIFYIEETGNHGLVCSDKDFGEAVWGSEGNIGAYGNGLADGSGMLNTKKIVDQASWDINENDILRTSKIKILTAARLCLESNYNGYEDWYLPTLIELRLINETLYKRFIGNMKQAGWYWSSTEDESTGSAWQFGFKRKGKPYYCCTSFQGYNTKGTSNRVLAIRAF